MAFGDIFWMSTYILLLFLTLRQVLYAHRLNTKISTIFGWKDVVPVKAVAVKPESRLQRETLFVMLTLGVLLLNFNIYLSPSFALNLGVIPPLLIIIAGLKFTRLRTNVLTGIVVGWWVIVGFLLIISDEVYIYEYLQFGLRLDRINFPHSSITDLVHLVLVGYFTVLFRRKAQTILLEADISWEQVFLPTPKASTRGFRKVIRFAVIVLGIMGANLVDQYLPRGLALLICCMGGCWLGPGFFYGFFYHYSMTRRVNRILYDDIVRITSCKNVSLPERITNRLCFFEIKGIGFFSVISQVLEAGHGSIVFIWITGRE
jgi:hypothetical protein